MPAYANAQNSDRISLLDNFGAFDKGEQLFVFGSLANIFPDAFLILQIINPNGDLCQIQQLTPLSNGIFITESIPLKGKICGIQGEYEIKIYYGDYSKQSTFTVSSSTYQELDGSKYLDLAINLVSEKINSIQENTGANLDQFSDRLDFIISRPSTNTISELEVLYVDLWTSYFIEEDLYDIDPVFRPAITSVLDSTSKLMQNNEISFDVSKNIDEVTFSSLFYYEIGDTRTAITKINDVFVSLKNVDPIKVKTKQTRTFQELEDILLNLMIKNHSLMNRVIKEEIAFIFARGTGPVYSAEINDLLDLLTQTRYLDVISRNNDPLFKLIKNEWDSTKSSLAKKDSIEKFLEPKDKVSKLYQAALLVRQLENVDRFITSDKYSNSELANLISGDWNKLAKSLEIATSVDDILDKETDIKNMKSVIDASSRISKTIEISQLTNIDSGLIGDWEFLLSQVENSDSIDEILEIVSAFDKSINELREKRNPVSILKFEYETMKNKAEIQSDYNNLYLINNALKILDTAEKMAQGNPSVSRIDRIEVLLAWTSEKAPEIKADLASYSKDTFKIRASDILQRAKSIENLVDMSLTKNRFLNKYTDFTNSMQERIAEAQNLVIQNDLDAADNLVRELFAEWVQVSEAYSSDPNGSDVGYSVDELKRIDYKNRLEYVSQTVSNFYNHDFLPYNNNYIHMKQEISELIEYGNYVDAELKLGELRSYISDHLTLNNDDIIYEIQFDQEKDIWILQGFVNKPDGLRKKEMRQDLYLTVYDGSGKIHSTLEFTDTKSGGFYTQWHAPTEPGIYVIVLKYMDSKASQVINIEDKTQRTFSSNELDGLELAREFKELKSFIETFAGENYVDDSRIGSVQNEIKKALTDRNSEMADQKLSELKRLIERYLPITSRYGVVEAQYENDKLIISGAVQKIISFREDLYVDVFDQQGNLVEEIALKDSASGRFSEVLSMPFSPGIYVAQLQYHDLIVTDFFTVL